MNKLREALEKIRWLSSKDNNPDALVKVHFTNGAWKQIYNLADAALSDPEEESGWTGRQLPKNVQGDIEFFDLTDLSPFMDWIKEMCKSGHLRSHTNGNWINDATDQTWNNENLFRYWYSLPSPPSPDKTPDNEY